MKLMNFRTSLTYTFNTTFQKVKKVSNPVETLKFIKSIYKFINFNYLMLLL